MKKPGRPKTGRVRFSVRVTPETKAHVLLCAECAKIAAGEVLDIAIAEYRQTKRFLLFKKPGRKSGTP